MTTRGYPLVSAVLAVRNEERYIEAALTSLLKQETSDWELEIIVVDGDSSDRTQEIVKRMASEDSRVKLAINKQRKTPYAFNLGIQEARGMYISIHGAHTTYAQDYIATCLEELRIHDAAGCSGREVTRPGGDGLQARLVAWTLAHPFGTSTGSMRTRGAGFADTIPYPLFLKSTLLEVGGYDTQLHRNQDNDLSQRLRARGYKLYITDKTSCEYFVSPDLVSLASYALKNGFWNVISFKLNPASMSTRHFVPGAFVAALLLSSSSAPFLYGDYYGSSVMVTNSNSYARGHLWGCNHRGGLPCCSETEVCGSPAYADRLPAAPCLLWRRNVVRDSNQCAPSSS